jgi:hypothetical protein
MPVQAARMSDFRGPPRLRTFRLIRCAVRALEIPEERRRRLCVVCVPRVVVHRRVEARGEEQRRARRARVIS